MKTSPIARLCVAMLTVAGLTSCGGSSLSRERAHRRQVETNRNLYEVAREETREEMQRFSSRTELEATLRRIASAQRRGATESLGGAPAEAAAPEPEAADSAGAGESITNNQVQGVDEGGIVKVHGRHLVVLRRGRLFTVEVGDRSLTPVAMIDAYPPGAQGGWYDEMLVHDDTIVVVGYNYSAAGTELGLFDIDSDGQLRRRGTHYIRSNDYYSSRNYASRLVENRLIFYMPYGLSAQALQLPAVRSRSNESWNEVIRAQAIYRPVQPTSNPTLHTVVSCDLESPDFACEAQGIVGPWSRSFYVSRDAVYVWVGQGYWGDGVETESDLPNNAVYRLPFDGSPIGAVRVSGMPVDQFSFQERNGHLNVLVRSNGGGDWMWAPEVAAGDIALVRLPAALFSDGVTTSPRRVYSRLPRIEGHAFQNRFVGDHLLYGTGGGWGRAQRAAGQVIVHGVQTGSTSVVALPHVVDRLDVMGSDAVVIGTGGGNLHFSAVELRAAPRVVGHFEQPNASQGETRSHGFFYHREDDLGGTLGLPIRGGSASGWHHLVDGSAGVLYLNVRNRNFRRLGVLTSSGARVEDHCRASCVDWYGNSRPVFLRNRVFALLGYELVEGQVQGSQIREVRRTHLYRDQPR